MLSYNILLASTVIQFNVNNTCISLLGEETHLSLYPVVASAELILTPTLPMENACSGIPNIALDIPNRTDL